MRFSWVPAGLLLALALHPACASSEDAAAAGGGPITPADGALVRFDQSGTITLAPREERDIRVIATPAERYRVGFALLGDPLDASLDGAIVDADDEGVASVRLRAPNQATTFRIRAALLNDDGAPGPSAEAGVSVSDQGFGEVRVLPQYDGVRPIEAWRATIVARATCADIAANLPDDPEGALIVDAAADEALLVTDAPVGPTLAVAVRAGHFAWGCADATGLMAGATLDVKVTVVDKPIDLAATNLDVTLDFSPDPVAYASILATATALVGDGLFASGANEATVLLDAMEALAPAADTAAFVARRTDQSWDALAALHFATQGDSLRERVVAWIAEGAVLQAPHILGLLEAKAGGPDGATLAVTELGSVPGGFAGIPPSSQFSWTADSADTLILGGTVLWQPSRFAGALAFFGCAQAFPGATDVPDALAKAADCTGLAATLEGFGGCDVACVETLCHDAIGTLWTGALDGVAASSAVGTITITASGLAKVSDTAEPIGFEGLWIGSLDDGTVSASVSGPIKASLPAGGPAP